MKKYTGKPRGFAAMSPDKRWAIASMGGRAAHKAGVAHEFTHDEAVAAGRKGGRGRKGGVDSSALQGKDKGV